MRRTRRYFGAVGGCLDYSDARRLSDIAVFCGQISGQTMIQAQIGVHQQKMVVPSILFSIALQRTDVGAAVFGFPIVQRGFPKSVLPRDSLKRKARLCYLSNYYYSALATAVGLQVGDTLACLPQVATLYRCYLGGDFPRSFRIISFITERQKFG